MSILNSDERMIPENVDYYTWSENYVKYFFTGNFVKDKVVLDIGCGTGYGTHFLIKAGAKKVIGIDNSYETIEYAQSHYRSNNLEFKQMDIDSINLTAQSFDVIIALEVIEHLKNPNLLLNEIKKLLKSDGVAILSTPNQNEHPKVFFNKFHVHEMNLTEFDNILKKYFSNVEILGYGFFLGSYVMPLNQVNYKKFEADFAVMEQKTKQLEPPFFIALCSFKLLNFVDIHKLYPFSLSRYDYFEYFKKNGDFGDKINPQQFLLSLIRFFVNEKKDFAKVLPLLEKILEIDQDNPELNYLAAFCLHRLNQDSDKALYYYDMALKNNFDEFWVRYNRGTLLFNTGKIEESRKDLEKAIQLRPDNKGPKNVLNQLEKINQT